MASEEDLEPKCQKLWSREEVFALLCTLNTHIEKIRPQRHKPDDKNMRDVVAGAVVLLSDELPFKASAGRVRTKLALLWKNCGDPDGDTKPYALYQYGAFTKTLPGLEDPKVGFPGMLNEIAEDSRRRQGPVISQAPNDFYLPRKSQRSSVRDESNDLIECRCRFAHNITSVKCDTCTTWQHTLCYYDTSLEDEIPKHHRCDKCQDPLVVADTITVDTLSLQNLARSLQGFRLKDENDAYESHQLRVDNNLGTLGRKGSDHMFWGPTDKEIRSTMRCVMSDVQIVTSLLLKAGLNVQGIKRALQRPQDSNHVPADLLKAADFVGYRDRLLEYLARPVRSVFSLVQVFASVVSVLAVRMIFYCPESKMDLAASFWEKVRCDIIQTDGMDRFCQLRRACIMNILKRNGDGLDGALSEQAGTVTRLLQELLRSMLTQKGVSGKSLPSFVPRDEWERLIGEVVSALLRLRLQMTVSERFYELYYPPTGTKARSKEMVDIWGTSVEPETSVEVCLMPAVIEYTPGQLGRTPDELLIDPSRSAFFINCSEENRSKGAVVSPAIIFRIDHDESL